MKDTLAVWLQRPSVRNGIVVVILVNALVLGLETSETVMSHFGWLIRLIDGVCLSIFIIELLAKLYAHGGRFFRNGWNIFDAVIVGCAMVPGGHSVSALRALRILRVLRVISVFPRLRRVVEGLVRALPGMGSVFFLMAILFYIGSVIATTVFGESFPQWFGTMGRSAYSLFQIMTLESWSMGIVRPVMEVYPYAWVFFVPFILLTTFAVVNLLVGLIVNSMQDAHSEDKVRATDDHREEVLARLDAIDRKLDEMRSQKP
ncbi:ion transporter [Donghicola sp. C2-DW-16]|uniref:Ion transporter n=1 Tax=Donghicola mangrovi TaxID=2729614 RepID=A0A850PZJ3_9RHOB|nr:ion transporter [Donghicola mangrovi]NVO22256.1 ion transporter [Donghicola mangrovi]NVO26153.1 ion transporter [Donghicola mangrovi]